MIEDKAELAALAYQLILGRAPKSAEAALQFTGNFDNLMQLRSKLFNTSEMVHLNNIAQICELLYRPMEADERRHFREFRAFRVASKEIEDRISAIVGEEQDNYARFHRLRFADQLRSLLAIRRRLLSGRQRVRVLDCGVMHVSRMYAPLLPEIELCTADFPGKDAPRDSFGSHEHYEINLELEDLSERHPELTRNRFDVILFCEILEHIRADPVEIFRDFKKTLAPDGAIYLTTPNALSLGTVLAFMSGTSRQPMYSKRNRVHERGGIHVREYTMKELVTAAESAGLMIKFRAIEEYFHPDVMLIERFMCARSLLTMVLVHQPETGA